MKTFNKIAQQFNHNFQSSLPIVKPMKTPTVDKFEKYAQIDWRVWIPDNYVYGGKQDVTSFAWNKTCVDQIKKDGFNGIVLNVQISIDPQTGKLKLIDDTPGAGNANKDILPVTWKLVEYAKKQGLDVTINFNAADFHTDIGISDQNTGPKFSVAEYFKSIKQFQVKVATLANKYKVDMIGIGGYDNSFHGEEYTSYWQDLVTSVRSKFKGQLTYTSHPWADIPLWKMVDVIAIGDGGPNPDKDLMLAQTKLLNEKYNKPVNWSPIIVTATEDSHSNLNLLSEDNNKYPVRYDLQSDRIREILKASIVDKPAHLSGISFWEYSPWAQVGWIKNPAEWDTFGQMWQRSIQLGSEFLGNDTASNTFQNWFNYSTEDIKGTKRNDILKVYAGDKKIDGGAGRDTVVIVNSIKDCRITKDTVNGGFDVDNGLNGIDGNYDMYNVEFVKFTDATVKLIGNYDLSEYGWF